MHYTSEVQKMCPAAQGACKLTLKIVAGIIGENRDRDPGFYQDDPFFRSCPCGDDGAHRHGQ
jgi:hypothetical protein